MLLIWRFSLGYLAPGLRITYQSARRLPLSIADQNERDIFVVAHQLKSNDEREEYLQKSCADRPELLERIRTLLKASIVEDGV